MNRESFERLVLTYGADLGRWPEACREAGAALAAQPEYAALLATAGELDAAVRMQAATPDELRLARLRVAILAHTAAPARRYRALRAWLAPRELMPVAAGVLLALTVTWAVRESRPAEAQSASTANAVVALLEYDTGLGVL